MFTGIIEEVGTLRELRREAKGASLFVATGLGDIGIGDSVAIDGVCLTATRVEADGFAAEASTETLERTTLGSATEGVRLNIERALAAGGRMGGHIVAGHVDGVGSIRDIQSDGEARIYRFDAPKELLPYFASKGSVAVDGVSLTINEVDDAGFGVTLIPHTLAHTTLGEKSANDPVNLETDVIAKYVVRYLNGLSEEGEGAINLDFLKKHGFA